MRISGVLTGGLAAIAAALALPVSALAAPYGVGAAKVDVTPPAFDSAQDLIDFPENDLARATVCPRSFYNGANRWRFEEPYQDTDGSGRFSYPLSGGGAGVPTPEPFCDYNHNGRWDGIYSSGGIEVHPESVHDPIDARALAFSDGDKTVAVVSVVAQGLHENYLDAARDLAIGTADPGHPDRRGYSNIVVSANHNESSPDTVGIYGGPNEGDFAGGNSGIDDYYYEFLERQIAQATAQAFDSMEPASLHEVEFDVPANIEQELSTQFPTTDDGDAPAAIDPKVRVLQARDAGGDPIFTMANVAAHNQEIGHGDHTDQISSDWPGYFHDKLEADLGGVGMFLAGDNGSMEDLESQPPVPCPDDGCFEQAQATGEAFADAVESRLADATELRGGTVDSQREVFFVPLENNVFRAAAVAGLFGQRQLYTGGVPTGRTGPDLKTSVAEVRVGPDLQFIANPGEAFPALMLGSPWGIDDPDGLNEDVGCPNRPNPSVPTWHASGTHRFQAGLADDMIGYEIPAWAFTEIPGVFTNQPPNADTCTNDPGTGLDPAGHDHKLETEGVGPSASNMVADHLTGLLNQHPDPAAEFRLGRFIHAPDANHPDTWLSRRAHDTRGGLTSDAIGVWLADPGSTDLAANNGTIVTTAETGSFGPRPSDAYGSFMDFDGAQQPTPDLSSRGMLVPVGDGSVGMRYYVNVYASLTHAPLGAPGVAPNPGATVDDVSISENGGAPIATFTVSLSEKTGRTATIDYQTSPGSASAGSDYQSRSGTLIFVPNDTSETVTVPVSDDAFVEPTEDFFLDLSNPVNAILADSQGRATILDADVDPTPPAGSGGGPGSFPTGLSGATGGRLGLSAAPTHARAGERSCFQVKVTAPDGSPAAGATVAIGRKSKLTNAGGAGRICRRFSNAKTRTLTASKAGYEAAALELRIGRAL